MPDGELVRRPRALFAVAVAVLAASSARAEDADARPLFLVTQMDVGADVPVDADTARDVLVRRFARVKDKVEVRSLAEVKSTLDQAALQQMLGGEDGGQLSRMQEYVQVDRIVFGSIKNVGGVLDVAVRVFNVDEGTTEISLARRLKSDAAPSLVLTVVESLADRLLAWTLQTYGGDEPSAAFASLQAKKLPQKADVVRDPAPASSASSFGSLTAIGGGVAAAGVAAAGLAGAHLVVEAANPQAVDFAALGLGTVLVATGAGLIAWDVFVE
jgi:hypothetical protein